MKDLEDLLWRINHEPGCAMALILFLLFAYFLSQ